MSEFATTSINRLRFEDVSFGFDGQDPLFERVDFELPGDQLVWVRAEHGEGRSTLLQLLACLQVPTRGAYWINEQNVTEMSFEEFLPYRLKIGYGFDLGGLIHNRTLFENLILPLNYHRVLPGKQAAERVQSYLESFGIAKYKDSRPSFVPGGARKIACLIRALVMHPEMILLDDPSVGVPQEVALHFFDVLEQLRKQKIVRHVFVSSFDEKFMSLLENTQLFISGRQLHTNPYVDEKKVVNL